MVVQQTLTLGTRGRGTYEITRQLQDVVRGSGIERGLCHLFLQHTSASLIICENADPSVRGDLERYLSRLVVDGDPVFEHMLEGDDDMAAHVRTVLTQVDMTLPIVEGRCALGTWQGVYLYEHRYQPHKRHVVVTLRD
ncbi:MAG: secondary thiamine-phosphate synthase enzyme YjbQ [Gammaproteobacteria bacterium]|nr:secondary thiamine-phosphate synthase enzyme YjbQ [Gammaproteobacteria bacterium]